MATGGVSARAAGAGATPTPNTQAKTNAVSKRMRILPARAPASRRARAKPYQAVRPAANGCATSRRRPSPRPETQPARPGGRAGRRMTVEVRRLLVEVLHAAGVAAIARIEQHVALDAIRAAGTAELAVQVDRLVPVGHARVDPDAVAGDEVAERVRRIGRRQIDELRRAGAIDT